LGLASANVLGFPIFALLNVYTAPFEYVYSVGKVARFFALKIEIAQRTVFCSAYQTKITQNMR
jgi:hypothetical protein